MRPALPILLIVVVFVGCSGGRSSKLPLEGFKVEFVEQTIPNEMIHGQTVSVDVTVKNSSAKRWPSQPNPKGRHAVNLSYHWLDRERQIVVFDGVRTALPRDLNPGESVTLKAAIRAPENAGDYLLHLTLVQEGVAWFSEKDGGHLLIPVSVK
jgi:hypothetical protein